MMPDIHKWKIRVTPIDEDEFYVQDKCTRDDMILIGKYDDVAAEADLLCDELESKVGHIVIITLEAQVNYAKLIQTSRYRRQT
jgi:hypothetical protein